MNIASMTIVLVLFALTVTLVFTTILSGMPQARAENDENGHDNNVQVNNEKQQINKCKINSESSDNKVECNNIIVYGIVCMPGSQCHIERFDVPFVLATPF
ncbi:MAG TPA: hypothetical protein VH481_10995 [Nitrososphaeraceae archaeon]|jgi:mannitol-specific phosphotransferase system IIBC component